VPACEIEQKVLTLPAAAAAVVVRYLEENIGGLGVVLSKEDLQQLEQICPADKVRLCCCCCCRCWTMGCTVVHTCVKMLHMLCPSSVFVVSLLGWLSRYCLFTVDRILALQLSIGKHERCA
jgi:hypothetical protein